MQLRCSTPALLLLLAIVAGQGSAAPGTGLQAHHLKTLRVRRSPANEATVQVSRSGTGTFVSSSSSSSSNNGDGGASGGGGLGFRTGDAGGGYNPQQNSPSYQPDISYPAGGGGGGWGGGGAGAGAGAGVNYPENYPLDPWEHYLEAAKKAGCVGFACIAEGVGSAISSAATGISGGVAQALEARKNVAFIADQPQEGTGGQVTVVKPGGAVIAQGVGSAISSAATGITGGIAQAFGAPKNVAFIADQPQLQERASGQLTVVKPGGAVIAEGVGSAISSAATGITGGIAQAFGDNASKPLVAQAANRPAEAGVAVTKTVSPGIAIGVGNAISAAATGITNGIAQALSSFTNFGAITTTGATNGNKQFAVQQTQVSLPNPAASLVQGIGSAISGAATGIAEGVAQALSFFRGPDWQKHIQNRIALRRAHHLSKQPVVVQVRSEPVQKTVAITATQPDQQGQASVLRSVVYKGYQGASVPVAYKSVGVSVGHSVSRRSIDDASEVVSNDVEESDSDDEAGTTEKVADNTYVPLGVIGPIPDRSKSEELPKTRLVPVPVGHLEVPRYGASPRPAIPALRLLPSFRHQQPGYGPGNQGYGPPPGGYGQQSGGYGPASGGYGPASGGYGPESGGYGDGGYGGSGVGYRSGGGGYGGYAPSGGYGPGNEYGGAPPCQSNCGGGGLGFRTGDAGGGYGHASGQASGQGSHVSVSSSSSSSQPDGSVLTVRSGEEHHGNGRGVYAVAGTSVDGTGKVTSYKDSGYY